MFSKSQNSAMLRVSCWPAMVVSPGFGAMLAEARPAKENGGPGIGPGPPFLIHAGGGVTPAFQECLRRLEIGRGILAALGGDVEADFLPFGQRAQTGAVDRADVDEHVLGAIARSDEAETLAGIEPFNSTCSHFGLLDAYRKRTT